jgi:hypothetical protein
MTSRRLPTNALSFKQFILRGRVLGQYREFMRALKHAPADTAVELRLQVRDSFRQHAHERDGPTIKALLAEGKRKLTFAKTFAVASSRINAVSGDSWVGTGEQWDVRGRVGARWPWAANS